MLANARCARRHRRRLVPPENDLLFQPLVGAGRPDFCVEAGDLVVGDEGDALDLDAIRTALAALPPTVITSNEAFKFTL